MTKAKKNIILQAKDHLVSRNTFDIHWDETKGRAWTDVQHLDTLDPFYDSSEYISHHSKPRSAIQGLYGLVRTLMFHYKYRLLMKNIPHQGRLLDVGCGTGAFLSFMKKKGLDVSGVENNDKARKICHVNDLPVQPTTEGFPQKSFDLITLWHVLEHLPQPEKHIASYKDLLQPGGILVIAAPNFESHDRHHYKEDWAALDVPRHLWHFTPKGLISMAKEKEFELIQKSFLPFDVFYIAYLSEKHKGKRIPLVRALVKASFFSLKALYTAKHSSIVYLFRKPAP